MSSAPFDLLREKREELGLQQPALASQSDRQTMLKGAAIGTGLIGLLLGLTGLAVLRGLFVEAEIDRLARVETEEQQLQGKLTASAQGLRTLEQSNTALVNGLIGTRSSSALMRDLQQRVPQGIQLTDALQQNDQQQMLLKGLANDPEAFVRINALQLVLERSPLVDADKGVTLIKAARDRTATNNNRVSPAVEFELRFAFREPIPAAAEKVVLEDLGAEGLSRRLDLLQKEGLLP
ncbi:PilN domain-containing protein [Cyanobium sp. LEGE 06143]|uniref:PilN domain-containing protein n=1 Tax=Cyanobium sp. LEGE 06143 TaxID=945727 RepID=UPI00187F140E|nr:PilN domain-containing protein [Cyanobium sp. LEGE 06143]MBE9172348.1 PilN domain-containing protein [Cyanobium sp. LEGE 06143]